MNMTNAQAKQFFGSLGMMIVDPIDPYPTDVNGNALTEFSLLTPEQQACFASGTACSVTVPPPLVREPGTGLLLDPATGQPYPGQSPSLAGLSLQTWLLIAAAGVLVYLLFKEK